MNPDLLVTIAFCVLVVLVAGVALVSTVLGPKPAQAGADAPAGAPEVAPDRKLVRR